MEFGKLQKKARLSACLSQKELGDKMGISASMVGQYETGQRNPKPETIVRFANALGTDFFSLGDISYISPSLNKSLPALFKLMQFLDDKVNGVDVSLSEEDRAQIIEGVELLKKSETEFENSEFLNDCLKKSYYSYFDHLNFRGKRLAFEAVHNIYQDPKNREN